MPTPIGLLTLVTTSDGLLRVCFGAAADTVPALASRFDLRPAEPGGAPGHPASAPAVPARTPGHAGVRQQFAEYFAGRRRRWELPIDWRLTGGAVRAALQLLFATVGYGESVTYGELAGRLGPAVDPRDIGVAMARNPIPVVVPCHRVLARSGLGGYGGGLEIKRALLTLEGILPPVLDFSAAELE